MILNGLAQREDMEIYSHLDVWGCADINAISINGNYVRKSPCSWGEYAPWFCEYNDWLIFETRNSWGFFPF